MRRLYFYVKLSWVQHRNAKRRQNCFLISEAVLPAGVGLAVYADDTTLYQVIPSQDKLDECCSAFQQAVDAVEAWGARWKIRFEPSKSQVLTVSHHRHPWKLPPVRFHGISVPEFDEIQLLGVRFDSQLSFKAHLRAVASKANQRIYFLRKAARLLDTQGKAKVFKGFVRPVLEYSPLVWLGASNSSLSRLDSVQRRALHVLGPGVLLQSLSARRKVAAMSYLYKLQCIPGPARLTAMVPPQLPFGDPSCQRTRRQLVPRHQYQLATVLDPRSRNSALRAFPHSIISDWNSLPKDVLPTPPNLKSLQGFKSRVSKLICRQNWLWATDHLWQYINLLLLFLLHMFFLQSSLLHGLPPVCMC